MLKLLSSNFVADVCVGVSCPYYGRCEKSFPGFKCVCPVDCIKSYAPVCSEGGETYPNICHLERVSCNTKKRIKIKHNGECRKYRF